MIPSLLAAAALLSTLVPSNRLGESPDEQPELQGLTGHWESMREALRVPGLAVVVVRDGQVVLLEGFGLRDVEANEPVTPETAFYIASCTKTYVALAVMSLAEEGELLLDDPVREYLPHFETADAELTQTLTLRDLLTHGKGLNCYPCVLLDAYTGEITEERYFHHLKQERATGTPEYTNVHYTLLGRVLEAVTGKPWREVLRERVFEPAGMQHTTGYADEMYARDDVALPTRWNGGGFELDPVRKTDRTMHAAGGLGTSARDAGRYLNLMLNCGTTSEGEEIVSCDGVREMLFRDTVTERKESEHRRLEGFGLAWMLGRWDDRPLAQHGGGYSGCAALISFQPEHGIGVAVLANASGSGHQLANLVTDDVYARFADMQLADWSPPEGQAGYGNGESSYAEASAQQAWANPAAAEGGLSLAPEAYLGSFENEYWGTVVLALEKGELSLTIGDLRPELVSTGPDTFRVVSGLNEAGRFVVTDGEVRTVIVELALGDTPIPFERR